MPACGGKMLRLAHDSPIGPRFAKSGEARPGAADGGNGRSPNGLA